MPGLKSVKKAIRPVNKCRTKVNDDMDDLLLALILAVLIGGYPQGATAADGQTPSQLAACPAKPNCVSSEAGDAKHAVAPFQLKGDSNEAWKGVRDTATRLPRSEVVLSGDHYLHVICRSRIFGFVDDLELLRKISLI